MSAWLSKFYFYYLRIRYRWAKRFEPRRFSTPDGSFHVPDGESFVWQYREIFFDRIYLFRPARPDALIIDCGANVGAASVYFRRLLPRAKIVALEADPEIARYCAENLKTNGASDVELINKAAWTEDGAVFFRSEGSDGGAIADGPGAREIPALKLATLLEKYPRIDLLKMDIEGAEADVLRSCEHALDRVDHLFVEYHSHAGAKQELADVLDLLRRRGFRVYVSSIGRRPSPFLALETPPAGMDLQLNIFARKEKLSAEVRGARPPDPRPPSL